MQAVEKIKTQTIEDQRSLGDLFTELANESSQLIRQEVALAQAEITQKLTKVGINVGYLVVGGTVAFVAFQAILASVIIGLGVLIGNYWLSALIVGIVIGVVAFFLITSALDSLKKMNPVPEKSAESIKKDAEFIKEQVT